MTKSFYSSVIFLTGIYFVVTLLQSAMFFRLGTSIYNIPSIASWSSFIYGVTFLWSLVMLKYYYNKQYQVAFWTLTIWTLASLFQFWFFYNLLATRELSVTYLIATFLLVATGIFYAAGLTFSASGERLWLKVAGSSQLVLGMIMIISFIWATVSISARVNGTIAILEQWISFVNSLIPLLFILNFLGERAAAKRNAAPAGTHHNVVVMAPLIAVIAAFFFVPRFAVETLRPIDDPDNIGKGLRRMAERFEANTFVDRRGDSLVYRLMKPLDYDSTRRYPLVVCLHGSSAVGSDNTRQVAATLPAQLLSTPENRERYPAFLFVPQCPRGFGWGGELEQPSVDTLVFEAIASLEEKYSIDTTRRYVSGYSMGGYGTWHFICMRPEMFAAAVPICGGGNPEFADRIVDLPVWAFHGAKDKNVPVSQTRDIINAIKASGGNPRYTEFPDAAHNIWNEVMQTEGLPQWLFEQKRE